MKADVKLGEKIHLALVEAGIETPMKAVRNPYGADFDCLSGGVYDFMCLTGLDMEDDSLKDTPNRVARMFTEELFWGLNYKNFPKITTVENKMRYDQVVCVANIETLSLCEHHFQTIDGLTHIGYIPNEKVLGLSKFARITNFFARRPQVQERMTEQIHLALRLILETDDVIVVQKCTHFCMKARGVLQGQALTTTSKVAGRFLENQALRKEFFDDIR